MGLFSSSCFFLLSSLLHFGGVLYHFSCLPCLVYYRFLVVSQSCSPARLKDWPVALTMVVFISFIPVNCLDFWICYCSMLEDSILMLGCSGRASEV
jgi:hypothetical protein